MSVRVTDDIIAVGALHNEQLMSAVSDVVRLALLMWPGRRVSVTVMPWDMDYGDVLPEGMVLCKPDETMRRYKETRQSDRPLAVADALVELSGLYARPCR